MLLRRRELFNSNPEAVFIQLGIINLNSTTSSNTFTIKGTGNPFYITTNGFTTTSSGGWGRANIYVAGSLKTSVLQDPPNGGYYPFGCSYLLNTVAGTDYSCEVRFTSSGQATMGYSGDTNSGPRIMYWEVK